MKERAFLILSVFLVNISYASTQYGGLITRMEYIDIYKDIAIREMLRTGVPASIKLAQGMLESDNGNSRLAVKANNHFGIKCHNDWNGRRIHHDDDHRGECFRKYKNAEDSYVDHSDFLRNSSRYSFLFELDPTDYKGWAKGLKKAGYATNPSYAEMLIRIIEENDLHRFDLVSGGNLRSDRKRREHAGRASFRNELTHQIYKRNRIDYIVVNENDSYESLQKELDLLPFEILKYNDMTRDSVLTPGLELYIQPKRNKAERGKSYHRVQPGETMYSVSQKYGIRLDRLYVLNRMEPGMELKPGTDLSLRKKVKGARLKAPQLNTIPEGEEEKIRFEFR